MKNFLRLTSMILLGGVLFSCSVQKRRYNKGWHVEWASAKSKSHQIRGIQNEDHKKVADNKTHDAKATVNVKERHTTIEGLAGNKSSEQTGRRTIKPRSKIS